MNPNEHVLMIHMLAQLNLFLKQLCDALKSNAVLTDEDIKVFGDFLHSEEAQKKMMLARTLALYLEQAEKLGVATGLEGAQGTLPLL